METLIGAQVRYIGPSRSDVYYGQLGAITAIILRDEARSPKGVRVKWVKPLSDLPQFSGVHMTDLEFV